MAARAQGRSQTTRDHERAGEADDERWPSESDSPGNEAVAHGPGHSRRIRQAGPVHSLLPGTPAHVVTIFAAHVRSDESHGSPGASGDSYLTNLTRITLIAGGERQLATFCNNCSGRA